MLYLHYQLIIFAFLTSSLLGSSILVINQSQLQTYNSWKSRFVKKYNSNQVEVYKISIWKANLKKIEEHNEIYRQGKTSYFRELNQYSDMSYDQFQSIFANNPEEADYSYYCSKVQQDDNIPQQSFHHNYQNCPNVEYKQNNCASGWAIASSMSLNILAQDQFGPLNGNCIQFSYQQLIDCTNTQLYRSHGCQGGSVFTSWLYYKLNDAVYSKNYPPTQKQDSCKIASVNKSGFRISECVTVESSSEYSLRKAVSKKPVVVQLNGNSQGFIQYGGGIYDALDCDQFNINHAVVVLGYDYLIGKDDSGTFYHLNYWVLQNSFGNDWGQIGKIRILRNENDTTLGPCGMYTYPSYPVL